MSDSAINSHKTDNGLEQGMLLILFNINPIVFNGHPWHKGKMTR